MPVPELSPDRQWSELLKLLLQGHDLGYDQTAWVMSEIIRGDATPVRLAAFLIALRAKGETPAEIHGLVRALMDEANPLTIPGDIVDIVGTGGAGGLNISTMASIVVAATGTTVVKHGNRAASSSCGSADLLERLGIPLELAPDQVERVAIKAGITFCFAPRFHPGLRHAGPTRRELGVPTVFNVLGPLANPARPQCQVVGVADARMAPLMAQVFAERGCSTLVVRGRDGLDELTTAAPSQVWVVRNGTISSTEIDPLDLGIPRASESSMLGGDPSHNAEVVEGVLSGEPGPARDAVVLNAAAALVTIGPGELGLLDDLAIRIRQCEEVIDSGAAREVLRRWVSTAQAVRQGDL